MPAAKISKGDPIKMAKSEKVNKRSAAKGNSSKPKKQIKKSRPACLKSIPEGECPFDFSTPCAFIKSLLSDECPVDDFFKNYWEKKPLHLSSANRVKGKSSTEETKDSPSPCTKLQNYFKKVCNPEILKEIGEYHQISFGTDLNACKYDGRVREDYPKEGLLERDELGRIMEDYDMTIQFHQPQRFHDELWRILEIMECYFGCLVGSNVYMTPEGTQGLAPHYDDVEVFILQLQGSKDWKLYTPVQSLARECSEDLDKDVMDSLKLIMEVTLNPGDVLYFPRGTVHEAKVKEGSGCSTHITISTYQNHCWGDFLVTSMPHLLDLTTDQLPSLREGLPVQYRNTNSPKEIAEKFVQLLDTAKEYIVKNTNEFERSSTIACDFYANRLPAYLSTKDPVGKMPNLKSSIRFVFPDHVSISRGKGLSEEAETQSDEENEDDESNLLDWDANNNKADKAEEEETYIYHTTSNDRSTHMVGSPSVKPTALRFHISCMEPLEKLKQNGAEFIKVEDLGLPKHTGLDMLVGLWAEGLIQCSETEKS